MTPMPLEEICRAIGSDKIVRGVVTGVSTDTRRLPEGCVFVAIRGERFDGHEFVTQAIAHGASWAVVDHDCAAEPQDKQKLLIVPDTKQAYIDIAGAYRARFSPHCVGVTGSVGKTTTKDMIATALSAGFCTLKTQGNLNNEIGLPETLMNLTEKHEAAVVEMGMQGLGEIARLCRAARPAVGVITNIGVSHMQQLGSRENILKAKLELAQSLEDGAPLVICGDDDMLSTVSFPRLNVMKYGLDSENYDMFARDLNENSTGCSFTAVYNEKDNGKIAGTREIPVELPCIGIHNVKNALAALLVGITLGLDPQKCAAALLGYEASDLRQHIVKKNGNVFVEDCYNASPDSMNAALTTLGKYPCEGIKIAVLGDMLELGELSDKAHFDVGVTAAKKGVDLLLCYGDLARGYGEGAGSAEGAKKTASLFFKSLDALRDELRDQLRENPGSVVWIKGSRGMHLERLLEAMD